MGGGGWVGGGVGWERNTSRPLLAPAICAGATLAARPAPVAGSPPPLVRDAPATAPPPRQQRRGRGWKKQPPRLGRERGWGGAAPSAWPRPTAAAAAGCGGCACGGGVRMGATRAEQANEREGRCVRAALMGCLQAGRLCSPHPPTPPHTRALCMRPHRHVDWEQVGDRVTQRLMQGLKDDERVACNSQACVYMLGMGWGGGAARAVRVRVHARVRKGRGAAGACNGCKRGATSSLTHAPPQSTPPTRSHPQRLTHHHQPPALAPPNVPHFKQSARGQ